MHVLFPDLSVLEVEVPAPADPFLLPIQPLNSLLRYTPNTPLLQRVHIRGLVTLVWGGRLLCIQQDGQGLCAQTDQVTPLKPADVADLAGFPAVGEFTPSLTRVLYRRAGEHDPLPTRYIAAQQPLKDEHDSQLVEIDGKLIGMDRAAKDPALLLSSGNSCFP